MIVRDNPGTLRLLFAWRGSILPVIAGPLLVLGCFSFLVTLLHGEHLANMAGYTVAPFALLGLALSIFLGFRNQACYARWWEGRTLWGESIRDVRSLVRATATWLGDDSPERVKILKWVQAHYHGVRCELRSEALPEWLNEWLDQCPDKPRAGQKRSSFCLMQAGAVLGNSYCSGKIDSIGVQTLEQYLHQLTNAQAGCERLLSTPLPFSYRLLTHRIVYLYCFLLPFGLVGSLGWLTPVFTLILGYTFLGLDALSEELEQPFGRALNHLPLAALCRVNDISIAEGLGEPIPEPVKPDNFQLD